MSKYIVYCFLMVAIFLPACATDKYWTKLGITEAEYKKDHYECERDAAMLPGTSAPYRPAIYPDTPYGNMQSSSDDLFALSHNFSQTAERGRFFQRCMESKGYILKDKAELKEVHQWP